MTHKSLQAFATAKVNYTLYTVKHLNTFIRQRETTNAILNPPPPPFQTNLSLFRIILNLPTVI